MKENRSIDKASKKIKHDIATYLNSLDEVFEQKQGKDFLVRHTKTIDEFVTLMFKTVLREFFGEYVPMYNTLPLTLVAMGSYGREELCVYSDIDLMFVYKEIRGYNIEPIIEMIIHFIWDCGLKVGHRVHRVEDILEASRQDITIKTAMIESRFVCGSKFLWIEVQGWLNSVRKEGVKTFLDEILAHIKARKERYPLTMEPNIKEGAGGLRDIHALLWISNVLRNTQKLSDLTPDIISEEMFKELRVALEFLYRLRLALHLQAHKRQDVLNLENIPFVAKRLGFKNRTSQSTQVALAKTTLKSLWSIKVISQIVIKKMVAPLMFDRGNISKLKKAYIEDGFYLCNGVLYTSMNRSAEPLHVMLKKFQKMQDIPMEFDISVIDYIKKTIIPAQNSSALYLTFSRFFHKRFLYQFLYAFYQASIFQVLLKPMKHTVNYPQFDGYHTYSVGIHSLKCVWRLENIEDIFIKSLFDDLCENGKSLLKLVVLMHDVGKGKKGDHSIIGARVFKEYAKKLNFSKEAIEMGDRLIRHHVLMSNVANRKDIYNEKVIFSFIAALKSAQTLKLLYILTYCDVSSVNKSAYSTFSSKLLRELYEVSLKAFSQDKLLGEASRRRKREKALFNNNEFATLSKEQQQKIMKISSNLFFLKYTSSQIISIASWAFATKDISYKLETQENLCITIICNQRINLSYILQKLSFLSVVQMEIFELFDNYKYFKIEFHEEMSEYDIKFTQNLILKSLQVSLSEPQKKPIIYKRDIKLDCKHSQTYAMLSLNTKDQKGLLAFVIYVFETFNLKISTAKIQTIKNRTRNIFLIEKHGILCDNSKEILDLLCLESKKV